VQIEGGEMRRNGLGISLGWAWKEIWKRE